MNLRLPKITRGRHDKLWPGWLRLWVAGGILLLGAIACFVLLEEQHPTLLYNGKGIEYWRHALPLTRLPSSALPIEQVLVESRVRVTCFWGPPKVREYGCWTEDFKTSREAIRVIGSRGIPRFMSRLVRKQPRGLAAEVREAGVTLGLLGFQDIEMERQQATTALILLKPLPAPVIRELQILVTNVNSEVAAAARCVLATPPDKLPPTFRDQWPNLELDLTKPSPDH